MDIFDRIVEDHVMQRTLMNTILKTVGDSDERRVLFEKFTHEFLSHAAAEEHAFYSPMLKVPATTDQSRHSVAEHSEAIELIEELKNTDMSSSAWLLTFKKLVHDNEHHMEEEEEDVFASVKKDLSDSDIEQMLPTFDDRKAQELELLKQA